MLQARSRRPQRRREVRGELHGRGAKSPRSMVLQLQSRCSVFSDRSPRLPSVFSRAEPDELGRGFLPHGRFQKIVGEKTHRRCIPRHFDGSSFPFQPASTRTPIPRDPAMVEKSVAERHGNQLHIRVARQQMQTRTGTESAGSPKVTMITRPR